MLLRFVRSGRLLAAQMIAGIISVRNEAGIIETTIRHHFDQGIDRIYLSDAMSTDGTRDILFRLRDEFTAVRLRVIDDTDAVFIQEAEMTCLARMAVTDGAEWIVPFDADEFIYATDNSRLIAETLRSLPENVSKLVLRVWRHLDWERREVAPEYPRKVVFRAHAGASVIVGQHDCSVPGPGVEGVLDIRELKYRSFEHFCRKISGHLETMRPGWGPQYATHVQQFRGASEEEMLKAWETMVSVPTLKDPIPSTLKGVIASTGGQ